MRAFIFSIIAIVFLFGIIAVAIFFFSDKEHGLNTHEKQAAMERLLGRKPILSTNPHQNDWIIHTGKYVTFSYPEAARIYHDTVNQPDKYSLETFMFQGESPKYFFGTEVLQTVDVQAYNDIPGVLMRRNNTNTYKETSMQYQHSSFPVFTKQQQNDVEKTAYILFNGKEYTFSITSANPDTLGIFDKVMESVKINDNFVVPTE